MNHLRVASACLLAFACISCSDEAAQPAEVGDTGENNGSGSGEGSAEGSGSGEGSEVTGYRPPEAPLYEAPAERFPASDCDRTRNPIIFVHGFLASGDTWESFARRFASNGYCADLLYAFDWNTVSRSPSTLNDLDALVDRALAAGGASRVDLVGHSAGGGIGYDYLANPTRAAKVAHYAHIASLVKAALPGPEGSGIETLQITSPADFVVTDRGEIPGATNTVLPELDHYAVATAPASFAELYSFFRGEPPATLEAVAEPVPYISGRVVSLGENKPTVGASVDIYPVDPETGLRLQPLPAARFIVGEAGTFGPFIGARDTYYEFEVWPADPRAIPVRYFRRPFDRSAGLVYLRTFPGPGSLAASFLTAVKFDDRASTVVVFGGDGAFLAGRDTLTLNGTDIATIDVASAQDSTIALFAYDTNLNQTTEATPVGLFESFPFLAAMDVYVPPAPDQQVEVVFGTQKIVMPGSPARSRGALIAVFERF